MFHNDGVEVTIHSLDREVDLQEYYKRRGGKRFPKGTKVRYIEATPGERFAIKIKLHKRFHFYDSEGVAFTITIDQGQVDETIFCRKPQTESSREIIKKTFKQCLDDKWVEAGVSFKLMQTDGQLSHDANEADEIASKLGRVTIEIQRGNRSILANPTPCTKRANALEFSSEDVIKKRYEDSTIMPESNSLKYLPEAPKLKCEFVPYKHAVIESAGTVYKFVFIYASNLALNVLGAIGPEKAKIEAPPGDQPEQVDSTQDEQEPRGAPDVQIKTEQPSGATQIQALQAQVKMKNPVPVQTASWHHSGAIDLTGDDDPPQPVEVKQEYGQQNPRKRKFQESSDSLDEMNEAQLRMELQKSEIQEKSDLERIEIERQSKLRRVEIQQRLSKLQQESH